ncbi:hypothetical protein SCB49_07962 [unidentified eubacterium SCB49]|nr:hypothetical protein SCB49_07962 [unidentified eubacterium SCB49]
MKKILLNFIILLSILFSFNSCGQTTEKEKNTDVVYVEVPNSKVSFPISSFKTEENLIGLIKGNKALIQVMELADDSFDNQVKNFKNSAFEQKGGKIIEKADLKVIGYNAKYMSVKSPDAKKLTMLLFGDNSFCVMISAINNSIYDETTNEEIEYLLKNIKYNPNKKIDPLSSAPFLIQGKSTFKHANFSANVHFYTKSGEYSKGQDIKPIIILSSGTLENELEFDQMFDFSIQMIEKYGSKIKTPIKKEKTIINGYKAYEETFELKVNGVIEKYYLLLLYSNNTIIQMQGKAENKNDLLEFKEFGKSIRIKK